VERLVKLRAIPALKLSFSSVDLRTRFFLSKLWILSGTGKSSRPWICPSSDTLLPDTSSCRALTTSGSSTILEHSILVSIQEGGTKSAERKVPVVRFLFLFSSMFLRLGLVGVSSAATSPAVLLSPGVLWKRFEMGVGMGKSEMDPILLNSKTLFSLVNFMFCSTMFWSSTTELTARSMVRDLGRDFGKVAYMSFRFSLLGDLTSPFSIFSPSCTTAPLVPLCAE